jgi:tRNA dimethylallyltransferase
LASYLKGASAAVTDITSRGHEALFVGGTPLYLRGLLYGIFDGPAADWKLRRELLQRAEQEGPGVLHEELRLLDPKTAKRLHPNDLTRIVRALEVSRATGKPLSEHQSQYPAPKPVASYRMIALQRPEEDLRRRIVRRTEQMFERGLVEETRAVLEGDGFNRTTGKAIGYKEVLAHLRGEISLEETIARVKRNTWRLARKQKTWLKSFPQVHWLDVRPDESPEETAQRTYDALFTHESLN